MNLQQKFKPVSTILILLVINTLSSNLCAQVNFTAPELIGRVTNSSITINVETDDNIDYYFEYGLEPGIYTDRIPQAGSIASIANEPFEVLIDSLLTNTKYYYRLVYTSDNGINWIERDEHSFHTQRSVESSFVFTITSDSHLSTQASVPVLKLYQRTLSNIITDNSDLHFDLGDTFAMTNVDTGDTNATRDNYLVQRENMGLISHSTPIFLVIGNHEDEEGWNLDDAGNNLASSKPIMGTNARKRYFLNPTPDNFFTGNSNNSQIEIDDDHLREDYFAFEWGDALFIGIDPYWNTKFKPYSGTAGGEKDDEVVGDRWDWTLGEDQYLWFKQTLESSKAQWRFVFSHQVVGGTSDYGRGGVNATNDYEWGAFSEVFKQNRPDWINNISIHQLMVDNNVTIFFHGHDHIFAKEEIDNMIYQECPVPNDLTYGPGFENYQNNDSTVVVNNSGHIRVSVSPSEVTVDYIRAYLPAGGTNGTLGHSYTISSATSVQVNKKPLKLEDFNLYQNYPNPFNPTTTINYSLSKKQNVRISVFNLMGKEIAELVNGSKNPGEHKILFDGSKLASGIYYYKIEINGSGKFRKMILLK